MHMVAAQGSASSRPAPMRFSWLSTLLVRGGA